MPKTKRELVSSLIEKTIEEIGLLEIMADFYTPPAIALNPTHQPKVAVHKRINLELAEKQDFLFFLERKLKEEK